MDRLKICNKCDTEFTVDMFGKRKNSIDGLQCWCKNCMNEYRKEYNKINKEAITKRHKKYRDSHKLEIKESGKKYWINNKEELSIKHKQYDEEHKEYLTGIRKEWKMANKEHNKIIYRIYYKTHREETQTRHKQWQNDNKEHCKAVGKKREEIFKEERMEQHRKWYEVNKKVVAEQKKEYRKNNKDKINVITQRYRAKKILLPNTLTSKQWKQIKLDFNNKCAYCNQELPLAMEHFLALSKGGEYTHNNIIPSCRSCNSSKSNKDFFTWYKTYKHYDKNREKFIIEYLGYENNNQQLKII